MPAYAAGHVVGTLAPAADGVSLSCSSDWRPPRRPMSHPTVYEGRLVSPPGVRYAVVASRFNEAITRRLVEGATETFVRHGADEGAVDRVWVPGAFELPLVAQRLAASGRYAAIVCLGAVIRGATAHFDYVASGVASGCQTAALATGVPVLFGVLTVDTLDQAWERAGTKAGNKGAEAAAGAIEMATLLAALDNAHSPAAGDGHATNGSPAGRPALA